MELSEGGKKEPLAPLGDQFLWNWVSMVFDVFIQEAGPQKTLSAIRPHIKHCGLASAQNALKYLGKRGSELETLTVPCEFIFGTIFGDDCFPIIMKETCAVGEMRNCPMSSSRPEICIAISHYVSEGWCEAINPDYEFMWTQHQTEGAPSCKFIIKRKDASLEALELEEERTRIPHRELSEEMKDYIQCEVPTEDVIIFTNAFLEVSGSERALKLLRERARDWGYQVGPAIAEKLGIKGRETVDLARLVDSFERTIRQNGEVISDGESAQKAIIECPLSNCPSELCLQLESFLSGVCESIDPSYEFVYDRMMTKGDKTCHWTIKKKSELAKEKPKVEVPPDDPAKTLAMRFAKGEITEEEFARKMAFLKEHYSR
jgi:predicted hydrocarbon binding protein